MSSVVANRSTNGAPMTRVGDSSETKPRVPVRLICCPGDFRGTGADKVVPTRDRAQETLQEVIILNKFASSTLFLYVYMYV